MTYSAQPTTIRGTTATPPRETPASSPPSPFAPIGSVRELRAYPVPPLARLCFARLDLVETLFSACEEDDIQLIKILVHNGADPNCLVPHPENDMKEIPILAYACMKGSKSLVQLLLAKSAVPAYEMLKEAFDRGHDSIVALLMNNGVSIDTLTKEGGSLLHMAVYHHQVEEVDRLIELGTDVDHRDMNGEPSLMLAFQKEDTTPATTREIMLKLLDAGADIDIGWRGDTPLIMAVRVNNFTAFSLLLDQGADTDVRSHEGYTLLQLTSAPQINPAIPRKLLVRKRLEF
jgi:ankyrin repeat protein